MYFDEPARGFEPMPAELRVVLGVSGAFILLFVFIAGPLGSAAASRRADASSEAMAGPARFRPATAARRFDEPRLDQRARRSPRRAPATPGGSGSPPASRPQGVAGAAGPGRRRAATSPRAPADRSRRRRRSPRRSRFVARRRAPSGASIDCRRPGASPTRLHAEMAERPAARRPQGRRHPASRARSSPTGALRRRHRHRRQLRRAIPRPAPPIRRRLRRAWASPVDAEALFAALARRMADGDRASGIAARGFAAIRAAWLGARARPRRADRVNLADRSVDGRFETIDDDGRLIARARRRQARDDHRRRRLLRRRRAERVRGGAASDELVFVPLGGVGEIGMNLGLYGFGPRARPHVARRRFRRRLRRRRTCPASISIFPDIAFLEEERDATSPASSSPTPTRTITARCSTSGRASACRSTRPPSPPACSRPSARASRAPSVVPINVGRRRASASRVGPFDVEYINVAHSIPESHALAIRTPLGTRRSTPATGSSTRRRCSAAPTDVGAARGARRRRRAGAGLRFDQRHARRPQPERDARSRASSPRSSPRRRTGSPSPPSPPTSAASARSRAPPQPPAARSWSSAAPCAASSTSPASSACSTALPPFLDQDAYQHLPRDKVVVLLHRQPGRAARRARPHRHRRAPARRRSCAATS